MRTQQRGTVIARIAASTGPHGWPYRSTDGPRLTEADLFAASSIGIAKSARVPVVKPPEPRR